MAPQTKAKRADRLDASDWTHKGLSVLAKSGIDAVRVEPLAKMMNVTKGSFYWHFKNRAELLQSMLEAWREEATSVIITRLKRTDRTPHERLHELFTLPRRSARALRGGRLELAIRNWARNDKSAERAIRRVDEQRMDFIANAYEDLGHSPSDAKARAFIFYSVLMGQAMLFLDDVDDLMASVEMRLTTRIAEDAFTSAKPTNASRTNGWARSDKKDA